MGRLEEFFKGIGGTRSEPSASPPLSAPSDAPATLPFRGSGDRVRRRIESHGLTHVGKVREGNEDHFLIASLQRSLEVRQTNLEDRELFERLRGPRAYLFAVADGVGGQRGGELASGLALATTIQYLSETVGTYHNVPAGEEHAFLGPLGSAAQRAHEHLRESYGGARGDGPATTLTMALVVWPHAFIVHVGDSRAYLLRDRKLRRLTRDQTMGEYLMENYQLTASEAERGGYNNVLSSAIGAADMTPAVHRVELEEGDVLLLCTDGLTKHVSEEQAQSVLMKHGGPEPSCRELVDLALAGGGVDNVTAIVVHTLSA
jgi:PPM family protein phosphatase